MRIKLIREETFASTFTLSVTPFGPHLPLRPFSIRADSSPRRESYGGFPEENMALQQKVIGGPTS
jgi:hypothetical protein